MLCVTRLLIGQGLMATMIKIGLDAIATERRQWQTYGNGTTELFTFATLFLWRIHQQNGRYVKLNVTDGCYVRVETWLKSACACSKRVLVT